MKLQPGILPSPANMTFDAHRRGQDAGPDPMYAIVRSGVGGDRLLVSSTITAISQQPGLGSDGWRRRWSGTRPRYQML